MMMYQLLEKLSVFLIHKKNHDVLFDKPLRVMGKLFAVLKYGIIYLIVKKDFCHLVVEIFFT